MVIPQEKYGLVGQRSFAIQTLVFSEDGEHIDLRAGCTGEEMLRDCTYGKKARLTRTKDASRLSSDCFTK